MAEIGNSVSTRGVDSEKGKFTTKVYCSVYLIQSVWTTLITNTAYLSGLLTLDYSLKKHGTKYPLIALYTEAFPPEGHKALDIRKIPKKKIKYLLPSMHKDFTNDPRFYDCWSKLTPFSLEKYQRVVQLDSDMLVLQNMDELMDIELDPAGSDGTGNKVFAASHACVCNPLKKSHYPKNWWVHPLPISLLRYDSCDFQDTGELCLHKPASQTTRSPGARCTSFGRFRYAQWWTSSGQSFQETI